MKKGSNNRNQESKENNNNHNENHGDYYKDLIISDVIKPLWDIIKNTYYKYITKIRFSIVLKLSIMSALRALSIMLSLNLIIIASYGYFSFLSVEKNANKLINEITAESFDRNNIPKDKFRFIGKIGESDIRIHDLQNKEIYTTEVSEDGMKEIQGTGNSSVEDNRLKIDDKRAIEASSSLTFATLLKGTAEIQKELSTVNYLYTANLDPNNWDVKVIVVHPLYPYMQNIGWLIIILLCGEVLLALLSINHTASKAKRILKPLDEMTATVRNITINKLDTRLNTGGTQNELKDLALTFNDMLDRLKRAYEIQNQFVSDASHELRTPIAVIQGYVNMLDRWGKEDEQVLKESIEAVKSEAEGMKILVESLLFLARGDKNTQSVTMDEFYLNELIDEIFKDTKVIDEDHKIYCDANEVIKIYADSKLIKQALRIFIDNSIKYTPKGGTITLSSISDGNEAVISIKDNGIGIASEDIPNIFNRFYRADKSRAKGVDGSGGTGLGLSIAKWIIMKHKGSIQVESALNKGTKIIVRIRCL